MDCAGAHVASGLFIRIQSACACGACLLAVLLTTFGKTFAVGRLFQITSNLRWIYVECHILEQRTAVTSDEKELQDMIDRTVGLVLPYQLEPRHQAIDVRRRAGQKYPTVAVRTLLLCVVEQIGWMI